jgi:hypothetical protein
MLLRKKQQLRLGKSQEISSFFQPLGITVVWFLFSSHLSLKSEKKMFVNVCVCLSGRWGDGCPVTLGFHINTNAFLRMPVQYLGHTYAKKNYPLFIWNSNLIWHGVLCFIGNPEVNSGFCVYVSSGLRTSCGFTVLVIHRRTKSLNSSGLGSCILKMMGLYLLADLSAFKNSLILW